MEGKEFKRPESALLDENAPLEEKLRRIDESIKKQQKAMDELQASILALKSQHNSLVPISCIPPEILGHIFTCVQAPELSKDPVLRSKREFLDRVALSHVCYHWRNIAVHSPNLWTALPIGNGKWVEEILKRSGSKGSCLDVSVAGLFNTGSVLQPGLSLALMHGYRFRELCLLSVSWYAWDMLKACLPTSAPQLERFHLLGEPKQRYLSLAFEQNLHISDCTLNETPRLRELELANCSINWDSHQLLQCPLTHLKLTNISSNSAPTGKRFRAILESMPELRILELNNCLPPRGEHGASSWGLENIHLLHLQTLRIESSLTKVEDFFHCVTFPRTAIVNVVVHHEQSCPDFSAVISEIARSYRYDDPDTVFQSLIFEQGGPDRLQLKLFTEVLSNFDTVRRAGSVIAHLDVLFHYPDPIALPKLMRDIFNGELRLDCCIRHACLTEMGNTIPPELLANTLGKLPLLNSVVVSPSATKAFLAALVHFELRRDITGGQTYFPAVSSICLYDATFVMTLSAPQVATSEVSAEMIQSFLIQRRKIGLPIETLVLLGCRVLAKDDIRLLKKIVANVHRVK